EAVALRPELVIRVPLHVRRAERRLLPDRVLVVRAPQPAAGVGLRQVVLVEVEGLERVVARLEARDGGELEGLPRGAPVAAAGAALGRPVPEQEAVPELVRGAADGELQEVLVVADRSPRPPAQGEVLDLERRRGLAHEARRRAEGPLADGAHLSVELPRLRARERPRDGGLRGALEPVVAEIAGRLLGLGVRVERVPEPET